MALIAQGSWSGRATLPGVPGDLSRARAHWVSRDLLAWSAPGGAHLRYALHASLGAGLSLSPQGVEGGDRLALAPEPGGLPAPLRARFPHLGSLAVFRLHAPREGIAAALRGQLAVSAVDGEGRLLDATGVQIPGVVDDLYTWRGPLGVEMTAAGPRLRLWAPTARSVRLHLFGVPRGGTARVVEMAQDADSGTWLAQGERSWRNKYYLYELEVYAPSTGRVERNFVTDPYSLSLSANGLRSQIVDLADPGLAPAGWEALAKPPLLSPADASFYELHVRDFSAADPTVPEPLRGTFKAFTLARSAGLDHLQALAEAGLTHVHLLPAFDFATVDEDRSRWRQPEGDLAGWPPDSDRQQAAVMAVADEDGFNWGYDPFHYTVPEGSYVTDPDGRARVREFREMVQALNRRGLRVVMDVVYNHTFAAGQDPRSVLDRVVPGYYHRLNGEGVVETSSCCPNTASEHAMMERLVVDSVVTWARAHKVDGFRFDLMGHLMKRTLLEVRAALDALTLEKDGVDGRAVYVYGEGWDFAEVAGNARGVNGTQRNMTGTGIGTFNDRLRDAARGGSAFGPPQEQGFLSGLLDAPNDSEHRPASARHALLLDLADRIRVGVAGNLADYVFEDRHRRPVRGDNVEHGGQPTGYAVEPTETINYVEAHDNETLFDALQYKAPAWLPVSERVRMHMLGVSLVGLAQGLPFFHAGMDLLRSKSLDRNSYNSGDWFNRVDWTGQASNFGVGLPPARDNHHHWPIQQALLANPALRPSPEQIALSAAHLREVLRIRYSTRLLRLRSADEVRRHLHMHNTGPAQAPGLIAWSLDDPQGAIDAAHPTVVVLVNALGQPLELTDPTLAGRALSLHPVQGASPDPLVRTATYRGATGTFWIPGRTAVVFWSTR